MAITQAKKHNRHPVRIHMTKNLGPHYAALRCVKCDKHIQWLSREDYSQLVKLGIEVASREPMTTHFLSRDANTRYVQVIDMYEPIGPIPEGELNSKQFPS